MLRHFVCAALLSYSSPLLAAQIVSTWINPSSGNWTDASRWSSTPNYPTNGTPAGTTYAAEIIASGSPYTVTLNEAVTVDKVSVGPDTTLSLGGSADLSLVAADASLTGAGTVLLNGARILGGTIANGGVIVGPPGTRDPRLENVVINTDVVIPTSRQLLLRGTTSLGGNGVIHLRGQQNLLDFGSLLTGQGRVVFDGLAGEFGNISASTIGGTTVFDSGVTLMTTTSNGQLGQSGQPFENRGTLLAENAGTRIRINGTIANKGFIHASGGGAIQLFSFTNSGSITAEGGTIMLSNVPADVGSFSVRNGGLVLFSGQPTTARVRSLDVSDSVISVQGAGINNNADTLFVHDGTNRWELASGSLAGGISGGSIESPDGAPLPVVRGRNVLSNVMMNADALVAAGAHLEPNGSTQVKGAIFLNGSSLSAAQLSTSGSQLAPGAQVVFNGGNASTRSNLVHGAFGGVIGIAIPAGASMRTGDGSGAIGDGADTASSNAGLISSRTAGRGIELQGVFTNTGTVEAINGGSLSATNTAAGSIGVNGASFTNNGRLKLGAGSNFEITGSFVQSSAGAMEVELAGTGSSLFGKVVGTGSVHLDGTLIIDLPAGYEPRYGDTYPFLTTSGGITGEFHQTVFPVLPSGLEFTIDYSSTAATVSVIPEPVTATACMIGLMCVALATCRR